MPTKKGSTGVINCVIDLNQFRNNLLAFKSLTSARLMAVLKADAYGHGLVPCARASQGYADAIGVARAEEALSLRGAGIKMPVLVLGASDRRYLADLVAQNVCVTVITPRDVHDLTAAAGSTGTVATMHIKIDTGMKRLGTSMQSEFLSVLNAAATQKNIRIAGVFTHFADHDRGFTQLQFNRFRNITDYLKVTRHCASSYFIENDSAFHLEMVRAGIGIYGYSAVTRPIMFLTAPIVQINNLESGETLGYNRAYSARGREKIAVIAAGYGDGIPRLVNKGNILINGKTCALRGAVCMDMMFADVTNAPCITGDQAVIYGADGVQSWAEAAGTITYDILTGLTERVKRTWINANLEKN